jgi:dihydrofolate synthase / folylpolyglutamate synthase
MKQASDYSITEWLTYLENRHQKEIQLGLTRVRQIAKHLGLLHFNAPVITIAGTNGKGSTIAALDAIYSSAGYQVATYTSPHLLCFNERIRIKQTNITDSALRLAFLAVHATPGSEALTYFEMVTLAALWYFKQHAPDVILLEAGLGGRLDATNCVDADLAIVTTIDLDHQTFLGETRAEIATEKAGIFRPNQRAIYADANPPQTLLEQALKLNLNFSKLHQDYTFETHQKTFNFSCPKQLNITLPHPRLNPQAFAAAIMASLKLQTRLPVDALNYEQAAENAFIAGRQQWLSTPIPTLVDVAHNAQSVNLLANFVASQPIHGKIHAVFSGLQDKTLYDLIAPMRAYVNTWYLTTVNHARSATPSSLKKAYMRAISQRPIAVFNAPNTAYAAALNAAKPGDVIVIYGSFLLVSAVMLTHLHKGEKSEYIN